MISSLRFGLHASRAVGIAAFALASLGAALPASAQSTNLVVNGSFESPPSAPLVEPNKFDILPAGSTRLTGWTIGGDSIAHVGRFWKAADGSQSVDLDGTGPGVISQTIATVPGARYRLQFKYSAHPDRGSNPQRMIVRFGSVFQEQFVVDWKTTKQNMDWRLTERTLTADSSSTVLSFTSDDPSNPYGVALDAVSLELLPPLYQLSTPVLIRAFAAGPGIIGSGYPAGTYVIGRVGGASNLPITVQAYTGSACSSGALVGGAAFGAPAAPIRPTSAPGTTDENGYFGAFVPGIVSGQFVTISVASPVTTAQSTCLVASAENDTWPRALSIDGSLGANDYIDGPGRARWYKFRILPDQRIRVAVTGLPADYDVVVFKDVSKAFGSELGLNSTASLTRLSAEYAPSTFSPSTFSPSTFSPSTFSPDAYSPSTFSPSTFSPDVYSPSTFSPSTFSPSTFSPSTFSPSTFSPSTFSPSTFSPSTFSPSTFSPAGYDQDELEKAFLSAQTRSMIGVSANPGTVDETVVVNSWNETGEFYVRVASRGGAYSTTGRFTLSVTKGPSSCEGVTDTSITARTAAAGSGRATVILTDSVKLPGAAAGGALRDKLDQLAAHPSVNGVVLDVGSDPGVVAKRNQADANASCPFAKNLLAEEIKGIVDSYRANNPLRYVVLAGGDDVIPFVRYPDQTLLGQESQYFPPVLDTSASQASLRRDFVLSQDAYGAGTTVSIRTTGFPVPGLAVGRLVENADEIVGMIDAFLNNDATINYSGGVLSPRSSLVTGYDFLEDAANGVRAELQSGIGTTGGQVHSALITPNGVSPLDPASWTAGQLATALFSQRHDVIFLAGHFSANSALAADFATDLLTTDLEASTVNLKNSIVFSAGCHSGYNLVDGDVIPGVTQPLDWAQAFARKQATLIAGTGYQYGDTDFLEYSERLYRNFARQLRAGSGAVSVGEALVKAKREYLEATPDMRGLHEKALLEAALFGLPMMSVNMPGARYIAPSTGGPVSPAAVSAQPWSSLGLFVYDTPNVTGTLTRNTKELVDLAVQPPTTPPTTKTAEWLSGPFGIVSYPAEPTLPLNIVNVTPTNGSLVLRGVGFREGAYTDRLPIVALTGAATTELRGVHVPFVSPVFYPMRPWVANYFGTLAGSGGTQLLVTPAQHRALNILDGTSTVRQYSDLRLRLFYSGNLTDAALSDAPTIVGVKAEDAGGSVTFTAQVTGDPKVGIYQVWITHTNGPDPSNGNVGAWTSLNLSQCVAPLPAACAVEDSQLWAGQLPTPTSPSGFRYIVQAAGGTGLVTLDDNRGLYYGLAGAPSVFTSLTLLSPALPASGTFGENVSVRVRLSASPSSASVANKSVVVAIGSAARLAQTNAAGEVEVSIPLVLRPDIPPAQAQYTVVAAFLGDDTLLPSGTSAYPFNVNRADTALSALALTPTVGPDGLPTYVTMLTAELGAQVQPLLQEAIEFRVLQGGTLMARAFVNTDYLGRAFLPATGLPAGSYTLEASFGGNVTYTPAMTSTAFTIDEQTITFGGDGLPTTLTLPGSVTFTVSSSASQPVTVTLTPESSGVCQLTQNADGSYTLTGLAAGTCTIQASAGGTVTSASVAVSQDIVVEQGTQTLDPSFVPPSTLVYLAPPVVYPTVTSAGQAITWLVAGGACSFTGSSLTATSGTGTCGVSGAAPGTTIYAPFSYSASIPLAKATQSIATFTAPTSVTYAPGGAFQVSATTSPPGRPVAFTSNTASVCTVAGSTVSILAAGDCNLTATLAEDANYGPTVTQSRSVTIARATQSITALTFTPSAPVYSSGGTFQVAATTTPAGRVATFASSTPDTCTVSASGPTVSIVKAGMCTITATLAGDTNYDPSSPFVGSVNIAKASQAISFAALANKLPTDPPFQISATTTANLAIAFAATGACAVSNVAFDGAVSSATVTLTGLGNCDIVASQAGDDNYGAATSVTRSFAVNAGTFASAVQMSQARSHHTATLLCDQKSLVIVGGFDARGQPSATSEVYTYVGGATPFTRTTAGNLPNKAAAHTAVLVGITAANRDDPCRDPANARVVVIGGGNASTQTFDAATRLWTAAGGMGSNRSNHTATRLKDGRVLIVGGNSNSSTTLATTLIYDPATGIYAGGPSLNRARERHTATLLGTGEVLIAGGRVQSGGTYAMVPETEVYDPLQNSFVLTDPLTGGRFDHSATALALGADPLNPDSVLMAGGSNGTVSVSTARIYAIATDLWSPTINLNVARSEHAAAPLSGSVVLVTGGRSTATTVLQSAEIYVGGNFRSLTGTMGKARYAHTATPFSCGTAATPATCVLITGGVASNGKAMTDAEFYR